jgi:hypothetical protein
MKEERAKILAKPFHIYSDGIGFHRLGFILIIHKLKETRGFGFLNTPNHQGLIIAFWRAWSFDVSWIDWKKARAATVPPHDNDGQTAKE